MLWLRGSYSAGTEAADQANGQTTQDIEWKIVREFQTSRLSSWDDDEIAVVGLTPCGDATYRCPAMAAIEQGPHPVNRRYRAQIPIAGSLHPPSRFQLPTYWVILRSGTHLRICCAHSHTGRKLHPWCAGSLSTFVPTPPRTPLLPLELFSLFPSLLSSI